MAVAVNIADMTLAEMSLVAGLMLSPVTPSRTIVTVERGRPDSAAVVLECDETRARAIVDTIRTGAKARGLKVRCYEQGPRSGWKEIR